jgi:hypothetical protein
MPIKKNAFTCFIRLIQSQIKKIKHREESRRLLFMTLNYKSTTFLYFLLLLKAFIQKHKIF